MHFISFSKKEAVAPLEAIIFLSTFSSLLSSRYTPPASFLAHGARKEKEGVTGSKGQEIKKN
jgi:hypothetical protein